MAATRCDAGFTMVEVIVSLTVLAMTVLSGTRAYLALLAVTHQSGSRTVASVLATRVLEQVRAGPESQRDAAQRRERFAALADQGPAGFAPPFSEYACEVLINRVTLAPAWVAPCWLTSTPAAPCAPEADHPNTMKWITVRVTFRGRLLAQAGSAVIRDMNGRF